MPWLINLFFLVFICKTYSKFAKFAFQDTKIHQKMKFRLIRNHFQRRSEAFNLNSLSRLTLPIVCWEFPSDNKNTSLTELFIF